VRLVARFLQPVFSGLVRIAAEIPDDATLEPDPNEVAPYGTRLDTLGVICWEWSHRSARHPLLPILDDILEADSRWRLQCAGLLAFARFPCDPDGEDSGEWGTGLETVFRLIRWPETGQLVSVAGREMLETSLPIRGWSTELIAILFKVVLLFVRMEDEMRLRVLVACSVSCFAPGVSVCTGLSGIEGSLDAMSCVIESNFFANVVRSSSAVLGWLGGGFCLNTRDLFFDISTRRVGLPIVNCVFGWTRRRVVFMAGDRHSGEREPSGNEV
jgi:hypothetical protein